MNPFKLWHRYIRHVLIVLMALIPVFTTIGCSTIATVRTDPKLHWRTFETKNFRVHYYEGYEADARRVAGLCEEAHTKLTREIPWNPWGKVHVVVADVQDRPDAKAVQFPYPELLVFLARPGVGNGLENYDDWLRLVIFHEYTHILSLDMARGFWGGMRYLLGRIIMPASVVPNWMSEGYAVYEESDKTDAGRNRSSFVDMVLRMDVLEDHWPPIDSLTVDAGNWPSGNQAYYHGGEFFHWLSAKHPKEEFGEYFRRYSANPLNFVTLNYYARKIYGKSFPKLYREFRQERVDHYQKQKSEIETKGIVQGKRLTNDQQTKQGLVYSLDGQNLLYSYSDGDKRSRFNQLNPAHPNEPKVIKYDFTAEDLIWGPSSDTAGGSKKRLYYSVNGKWRDYYEYLRLYELDLDTKEINAINFKGDLEKPQPNLPRDPNSESRRFFNPHMSEKGDQMVFVGRDRGVENLWLARFDDQTGKHTLHDRKVALAQITKSARGVNYDHPRFSPDGTLIAVSRFEAGSAKRDMILLNNRGEQVSAITDDAFMDYMPVWSPDGRKLYFVSDRTGVFNVFAWDLDTKKLFQVTNVMGGTFNPTISPDGKRLAYFGYHANGFDVYEMHLDPHTFFPAKTGEHGDTSIDPGNDSTESPEEPQSTTPIESKPYLPWRELLLPRFLAPEILIIDTDDLYYGVTTGSVDAIRRHAWQISGNYRPKIEEGGGSFSYSYTRWYPELFVTGAIIPITQSGTLYVRSPVTGNVFAINGNFQDDTLIQRDYIGRAGASIKVPIRATPGLSWVPGSHTITAAYEWITRQNRSDISPQFVQFVGAPNPTPIFAVTEYDASGLGIRYSYTSTLSRPRGISPTGEINTATDWLRGHSLALGYELFNEAFGGNWNQQVFRGDFRTYRRIPFTDHNVLALRAAGGFTQGDDANPETFRVGGAYSEGEINVTTRNSYPIRGFGGVVATGEQFMLLSGEYRFPIWLTERGISTWPVYIHNIHGAGFLDYGNAGDRIIFQNDNLDFNGGYMGTGLELRGEFTILYNLKFNGRIGYGVPVLARQNNIFDISNGEWILAFGTTF